MTRASTPQTLRLICLTTSLPDAVKQGCLPAREARGLVTLPSRADGFSLPHLRRPPQFSQIILAEDCTCTLHTDQTDPLIHPLTGPEGSPPSVRSGNASFRPGGGPSSLQTREVQEAPGVSRETPITHTAALRDRDYGTWHGQALNTLAPEALHALLHDPDFAPPEGESLRQLHARVEIWLTTLPQEEAARGTIPAAARATGSGAQTLLIIARPAVVRALACVILGGGPEMAATLDIPPQTTSLFTHHAGHWRVRALGAG